MTYARSYTHTEENEMKVITCNLPRNHLKYIQKLLEWGHVPSRSEYIRKAVDRQIERDLKKKKYITQVNTATEEDLDETLIKIPGYKNGKCVKVLRRLE